MTSHPCFGPPGGRRTAAIQNTKAVGSIRRRCLCQYRATQPLLPVLDRGGVTVSYISPSKWPRGVTGLASRDGPLGPEGVCQGPRRTPAPLPPQPRTDERVRVSPELPSTGGPCQGGGTGTGARVCRGPMGHCPGEERRARHAHLNLLVTHAGVHPKRGFPPPQVARAQATPRLHCSCNAAKGNGSVGAGGLDFRGRKM